MRKTVCVLLLSVLVCGAQVAPKHRVLFNRYRVPEIGLFVADANGKNERALPHVESEYSPSLSVDGKWIVFTSERGGQSDIYRVHPDGSAIEQLTSDPAFDDQGALSPDGATVAFVSTRNGGNANIWLLDLASKKYRNLTNNLCRQFPAELVSGRAVDRLQLGSRRQSRQIPRRLGAHAVDGHLRRSPGWLRTAPAHTSGRIRGQPELVGGQQEGALLRDG